MSKRNSQMIDGVVRVSVRAAEAATGYAFESQVRRAVFTRIRMPMVVATTQQMGGALWHDVRLRLVFPISDCFDPLTRHQP